MATTSNAVELLISQETAFAQPSATPSFKKIRLTSESVSMSIDSAVSEEIIATRNRSDLVMMNKSVSGDVSFELSVRSFDDVLKAVMCGDWTGPVAGIFTLKNGLSRTSWLMQKRFKDAEPPLYHNFYGVRFDTFELTLTPAEIVDCSVSVVGKYSELTSTQLPSITDLPADVTTPLTSSTNIMTILDNGVESTDLFSSLTIKIANNLRPLMAVSIFGPVDINYGSMDITGNLTYYFKNSAVYSRMIADTAFAISFIAKDDTGLYYRFTVPRLKLETAQITAGGLDQDMAVECAWRAMYDPVTNSQLIIEKYDYDFMPQLLLDLYPGAGAAFSLRKLRSQYSGFCVKVRNSSNLELDIPYLTTPDVNGDYWIDEVALLAHTGSGDGWVTTWYDNSMNPFNASNVTAAQQPKIVLAGVVYKTSTGKPAISFTGGTRLYLYTGKSIFNFVSYAAVFTVYQRLVAAVQCLVSFSVGGSNLSRFSQTLGGGTIVSNARRLDSNANTVDTQVYSGLAIAQITSEANYANGTLEAILNNTTNGTTALVGGSGTTSASDSSANPGIGISTTGGDAANGYISEVAIYNSSLSTGDRASIATNQMSRFGVTP